MHMLPASIRHEYGLQVTKNAAESKQTHAAETICAIINKNLKNTKQQKTMKSNEHDNNGSFPSLQREGQVGQQDLLTQDISGRETS